MDFVVGLPRTLSKFDTIWVIVDRLTKSTHFIPVCTTYSSERLAEIYIREIVCLHAFQIEVLSLLHSFGGLCSESWELRLS